MTDYYVDWTSGNDGNPGTIGSPWKSTTKVSDEFGAATFAAGDQILFKRGETWIIDDAENECIWVRGCSGTIGNHIYIGAYSTGATPILDGDGNNLHSIERFDGNADANYITVEGLEFKGNFHIHAMYVGDALWWIVKDCYFHDITSDESGYTVGLKFAYNSQYCIVDNCTFEDIQGEPLYLGQAGIETDRTRRIVIKDCTFIDNWGEVDCKPTVDSFFIYNCSFHNNGGWSGYMQMALGGSHHVVYKCRFLSVDTDNWADIYMGRYYDVLQPTRARWNHVERCLFKNFYGHVADAAAVAMRGDNQKLMNCTFVNSDPSCIYAHPMRFDDENVIENNIFYDWGAQAYYTDDGPDQSDLNHNDYGDGTANVWNQWGNLRDFAFVQGLGEEAAGITDAPDFAETGNYTLDVGAPQIDIGDPAATVYDWNDEYVPSGAPDIGWSEYGTWNESAEHRIFGHGAALTHYSGSSGVSYAGCIVVNITDTTNRYAYRTSLGNLKHFWTRFYIRTEELTMTSDDEFVIFEGRTAGGTALVRVYLQYDGSNKRVRAAVYRDDTTWDYTGYHNLINSGWEYIELFWFCSPHTDWNEGEIILAINGVYEEQLVGQNNHDNVVDAFYVGAVTGLDAGTSGNLYFDWVELDWIRQLGAAATGFISRRIAADADDALSWPVGQFNTTSQVFLGNDGGWNHSGLRFTNITIPAGSVINNAYLTFTARDTLSADTVRVVIKYQDADSPADFSADNYASFEARARSAEAVHWDFTTNWVQNTEYISPDLAALIQALVDEAYWDSGDALVLFVEDDSSDAGAYRTAYSHDDTPAKAVLLEIDYTEPAPPVEDHVYLALSSGSQWWYTEMTKAV